MENIEKNILDNFKNIDDDIYGNFHKLWMNSKNFKNHIKKRLSDGHISDKEDYISKTLNCLGIKIK